MKAEDVGEIVTITRQRHRLTQYDLVFKSRSGDHCVVDTLDCPSSGLRKRRFLKHALRVRVTVSTKCYIDNLLKEVM